MKPITIIYIKSFLLFSLVFGFAISLIDYLGGDEIQLWKQIIQSLVFGLFMSWSMVSSQKRSLKQLGIETPTDEDFSPVQSAEIRSSLSLEAIYEVLQSHAYTKKWKLSINQQGISGKTNLSFISLGEKINISKVSQGIHIESKPLWIITLFDYGKNLQNVILLKKMIED
jgi:hypothetical protein